MRVRESERDRERERVRERVFWLTFPKPQYTTIKVLTNHNGKPEDKPKLFTILPTDATFKKSAERRKNKLPSLK